MTSPDGWTAAERGLVLLVSSRAGSAERAAVEAAARVLRAAGSVESLTTGTPQELDAALARVAGRLLVIAGGDGSVHLTVNRLWKLGDLREVPVAVIPLGTGNDLARGLGIPLEPVEAARLIVRGEARPVDLLVDDTDRAVINAVHVGIGAEAAQHAGRYKSRLGPLAYLVGAVSAGFKATGWHLRVETDGPTGRQVLATPDQRTLMVGVGNGPGIGGGTPLLPDAIIDDGLLDVVVSAACGPLARAAYGAALRAGRHLERADVAHTRACSVTVSGEPVQVNADGEVGRPVSRRTWRVEPGAWRLVHR